MLVNRFGNAYFVSLHGVEDRGCPPDFLGEQVEVVQRPGYDGSAIIKLGTKGAPFQMRSFVDAVTPAAALLLGQLYKSMQGSGSYGLIWAGINFLSEFNLVYVPLEVKIIKVRRLSAAVGGLYPPSTGCIEALWTLMPVAVVEDEEE